MGLEGKDSKQNGRSALNLWKGEKLSVKISWRTLERKKKGMRKDKKNKGIQIEGTRRRMCNSSGNDGKMTKKRIKKDEKRRRRN